VILHASKGKTRHGKPDQSSREIDTWMEAHGASIVKLDGVGNDVPDRLYGFRGKNLLVELKTGTRQRSDGQEQFARTWRGDTVYLWRTIEDARRTLQSLGFSV
jgi:hypothetical protein